MSFYAQYGNTIVLAVLGVLIWFYLRGRFEQIDLRFDRMDQRFDHRIDGLEAQIAELRRDADRKFELLVSELNGVRSDITQVALAVGARTRPEANPA